MDQKLILFVIAGMGVTTIFLKSFPLVVLPQRRIPDALDRILKNIPVAVLTSMVVQFLVVDKAELFLSIENLFLWISVPTFLTAVITKNLFITTSVGMGLVILARLIIQ